jgi:hypothetical protein
MRIKAGLHDDVLIFDTVSSEWVNFSQKLAFIEKGNQQKYQNFKIL